MITPKLLSEFRRSASQIHERSWSSAVSADQVEDVVQELAYNYLAKPHFRSILDSCKNAGHRYSIIKPLLHSLFAETCADERLATNQETYSIESVKDFFKGRSENKHLLALMPEALQDLETRHAPYAESLKSRYFYGIVPEQGADQTRLRDAHRVITDEVNRLNRGDWVFRDGPSLSNAVPAEERKGKGATSDPTADMALAVMASVEAREVFYGEDETYSIPVRRITEPTPNPAWSIFDDDFRDMPGVHSYRASVFPELYPNERSTWNG